MKIVNFLIISAVTVFLNSCTSSQNAFSQFNFDKEQERSVSSLLSSKIKTEDGKIKGVVSAIYLNDIYPNLFNNNDYFFVYFFLKDKKNMSKPNHFDKLELNLKLNGHLPIKVKQLPNKNRFSHLASTKSDWNKYYLISFKKQNSTSIKLVLKSGKATSSPLIYQKR